MEEQSGETVARARVENDTAKPPSDTRRADRQRVYLADRNSKRIRANGAAVGCCRGRRRNKVSLAGRGRGIGEVDLDIGVISITEGRLGEPSKE